jgi:hypothetical protein
MSEYPSQCRRQRSSGLPGRSRSSR